MKHYLTKRLVGLLLIPAACYAITLTPEQAQHIGKKIWHNECRGTVSGLTSWNRGEEFASLGIGHFLWCPQTTSCPFSETFPLLLTFLKQRGKKLPAWLMVQRACPWNSRAAFMRDFHSPHMKELRRLLVETIDLQTAFIVQRLERALPKMVQRTAPAQRAHIQQQFNRLEKTSQGLFALIDYVNFKGEGTSSSERYNGQGWGLLQVLDAMKGTDPQDAVVEFVEHAKRLLALRIHNAPRARREGKWLPGWKNRLDRYVVW